MSDKAKTGIVLLAVALVALPLACKPTGNQDPAATGHSATVSGNAPRATGNSEVAGTYNLVSVDGHPVPYPPRQEGQQGLQIVSSTLTLNGDGTFVSTMNYGDTPGWPRSRDFKGTYAKQGADYVLTWEGAGQTGVTIDGGTLTMNNEGMLFVYQKANAGTASAALTESATDSAQQKVLDRFIGNWSCQTTIFKTEGNPEEKHQTGTLSYTRILGGNFVQEKGEDSGGNTSLRLYTYDHQKKCYLTWFFSSIPQSTDVPATGKWDEAAHALDWTAKGSTFQHRFINDNAIECSVLVKNDVGNTLFQAEYKLTRTKELGNDRRDLGAGSTANRATEDYRGASRGIL